ncbi:hypothetical protein ACFWDA_25925, partial [Rhodococcus zopfii]
GTDRVRTTIDRIGYARTRCMKSGVHSQGATSDRIDRTVTATSDGQFRFAGLVPGRYALLDETGQVLCHLDVDADDPVVEDLTVTPMNRSL